MNNGPVENTVRDPEYGSVFYTPRFSYGVLKLRVTANRHVLVMVCTGPWVQAGRVYGWVYRVGIPGSTYPADMLLGERLTDSEAGPGRPARPGVGGLSSSGVRCTPYHPLRCAPGPAPLYGACSSGCRLWANKGEISLILV